MAKRKSEDINLDSIPETNLLRFPPTHDHCTLENYVPHTPEQENARTIATACLRENKGLYLYGAVGVGKTHLAVGIAREISNKLQTGYIGFEYLATQDFCGWAGEDSMLIPKLLGCTVLIIDDVHAKQDRHAGLLRRIVQERYDACGVGLVMTSNYPPLDVFKDPKSASMVDASRAASRLHEMCVVYEVKGPDVRQRIADDAFTRMTAKPALPPPTT